MLTPLNLDFRLAGIYWTMKPASAPLERIRAGRARFATSLGARDELVPRVVSGGPGPSRRVVAGVLRSAAAGIVRSSVIRIAVPLLERSAVLTGHSVVPLL